MKKIFLIAFLLLPLMLWSQTIASFNIRRMGDISKDYDITASIIRNNFDVCGVIEVMNVAGIQKLTSALGPGWNYLVSEKDIGRKSYREYYGIVWNSEKAKVEKVGFFPDTKDVFEREPYLYKITLNDNRVFVIAFIHVVFGDSIKQRRAEIVALQDVYLYYKEQYPNLIFMGDFNMEKKKDFASLFPYGYNFLQEEKTTLGISTFSSTYDHILCTSPVMNQILKFGVYNPIPEVISFADYYKKVSDHLPIYMKF